LALALAFLPSVMLLGFYPFVRDGQVQALPLVVACLISIGCCFASAIMLFRRNTGLALAAGVLFLLLNMVISFLFGCGVVLTTAFSHP